MIELNTAIATIRTKGYETVLRTGEAAVVRASDHKGVVWQSLPIPLTKLSAFAQELLEVENQLQIVKRRTA